MVKNAIFVDGNWCYGCHSCEVACQVEHKLPLDQSGIKVIQIGVWDYQGRDGAEKWQHDYLAIPTSQCNICASIIGAEEKPLCEKVCPAQCLKFGEYEILAKTAIKPKQMVYRIK